MEDPESTPTSATAEMQAVETALARARAWMEATKDRLTDAEIAELTAGIETATSTYHVSILRLFIKHEILPRLEPDQGKISEESAEWEGGADS